MNIVFFEYLVLNSLFLVLALNSSFYEHFIAV